MRTLLISIIVVLSSSLTSLAQRRVYPSPKVTIEQKIGLTTMELEYSRPSLNERTLEEAIGTRGNSEVWRLGANENTKISFDKDVTIGGMKLKAGRYSMYAIPGGEYWTIIINKAMVWGTQYDQSQDVLRFKAEVNEIPITIETFEIHMTDHDNNSKDRANIEILYGNISVKFPIVVDNSLN